VNTARSWHVPPRRRSSQPGGTTEPPLLHGEPIREWAFSELRGDALVAVELDDGIQVGGLLHELHDFGLTFRDSDVFSPDGTSLPSDGIATGQITSTADGVTYWVGAEAPAGIAALPEAPIGGRSRLHQTQSFHKRAPDASLSFTVSAAFIETTDLNGFPGRPCPPVHADGLLCDLVKGELFLDVQAFTVPAAPDIIPFNTFFPVAGGATVSGFAPNWNSDAWTTRYSQLPLWKVEDFDFVVDDLDGIANDVTIQPDGRIVIAGRATLDPPRGDDFDDLFVARLLADGQPDRSFGPGGQVVTDVGGLSNEAQNVVVQPADAMIVISGSSRNPGSNGVGIHHHTDLARYRPDGQPDPTFGTGGTLTLDAFVGADLAVQPDGALLLVGTADTTPPTAPPGSVTELSVIRLEPDGTPDETFGDNGTVNVSVTGRSSATGDPGRDSGAALALQPDGRIVIAGATAGPNSNFAIARLLADGTLDTEFTDTGVMTIDFFGSTDLAESVAVTDGGSIVVAGQARDNVDGYGVARVSPQDTGPTGS
jgi:uncharacterized delta-60 repeat protein